MFTITNKKSSRMIRRVVSCGVLSVLAVLLANVASAQDGQTRRINCDNPNDRNLNRVIERSNPGDTILIRGTCIENINLNKGITLDGEGTGSIVPADPALATISVSARNAVIKGLNLNGANDGMQIFVTDRSLVTIENNKISNGAVYGIGVFDSSSASIVGNNIFNNDSGIFAVEASTIRVGFKSLAVNDVIPNVIENNTNGVLVARAFGNIAGNQIINNSNIGVISSRTSSIRVASNEISGNNIGIANVSNSTTDLALSDDGLGLFGSPNFGVNVQLAMVCNSGFTSGLVGSNFAPAFVVAPCESQLVFPPAPPPPPPPAP